MQPVKLRGNAGDLLRQVAGAPKGGNRPICQIFFVRSPVSFMINPLRMIYYKLVK